MELPHTEFTPASPAEYLARSTAQHGGELGRGKVAARRGMVETKAQHGAARAACEHIDRRTAHHGSAVRSRASRTYLVWEARELY